MQAIEAPPFFVPAATVDNQESVFSEFAGMSRRPVPKMAERIYSITYVHDGVKWTATVGEHLRGVRLPNQHSRSKKAQREEPVSDPARVLAIFAGVPYMVVTNHRLVGNVRSAWENPFMAGQPISVTYFSAPQP
jgi:hypothetical protein